MASLPAGALHKLPEVKVLIASGYISRKKLRFLKASELKDLFKSPSNSQSLPASSVTCLTASQCKTYHSRFGGISGTVA